MEIANQLYICFGTPIMGLFLYYKLFEKVEDSTVFFIGFLNTINFFLWFTGISTAAYWGPSVFHLLGMLYLFLIAPILSIGFAFWLFMRRNTLTHYRFSLFTSIGYVLILAALLFLR